MNGQALELVITLVLVLTLRLRTTVVHRIAARLGVAQTLDLIAELNDDPAVAKWVSLAREAVAARNEAIHTAWFLDPETGQTGRWHRRTLDELPAPTPAELEKTATLIVRAIESGRALLPKGSET